MKAPPLVRPSRLAAALFTLVCLLTACPSPRHPTQPAGSVTLEIGRDGSSLRAVAGDPALTFAALTSQAGATHRTVIEARRGNQLAWQAELAGQGGPIARTANQLVVSLAGEAAAGLTLRGAPGAVVVALDAATGGERWKRAIDASEWSVIAALAAAGPDVIVGGSFSGTLRIADQVVSSGGKSDGFVARLTPAGEVTWLVRTGGPGADAVLGVAASGKRIAIAGTFATGADLLGEPLPAYDDKTPRADGFVAELDAGGARRWSTTFGGKLDDSVVGVAIDDRGRVAVAMNAREVVRIGTADIVAMGPADGVVAWWDKDGTPGTAIQIGGADFDGLRAIVAVGDHVVVGGFFSGKLRLGDRTLTAGGGDDAFLAAFDGGRAVAVWPIEGDGREEIAALAAVPGGFIAGVTHTAGARISGARVAAPRDATSGAALAIRPIR